MNDAEFAEQKARVQAVCERWAPIVGLTGWELTYVWERSDGPREVFSEAFRATAARVSTLWEFLTAMITFYLPDIATMTDDRLTELVLHEFAHILVAEIAPEKFNKPEERVVTSLARAFKGAYDAGVAEKLDQKPQPAHKPGELYEDLRPALGMPPNDNVAYK